MDLIPGGRKGSSADDAILRLHVDDHARRNEVGGTSSHPDAEVDAHPVLELDGGSPGDPLAHDLLGAARLVANQRQFLRNEQIGIEPVISSEKLSFSPSRLIATLKSASTFHKIAG